MPRTTTQAQLAKLEAEQQKLAEKIKKRREQLKQQELKKKRMDAERERKLDTRRKVVMGGLVMAHMERDPVFADQVGGLMRRLLHDRDKALFPDLFPVPEPAKTEQPVTVPVEVSDEASR